MIEWYAKHFGIGEIDILEAPWIADWIDRNRHRLRYSDLVYRWFLVAVFILALLPTAAHAQRVPGYPPANNFYVGNGATRSPSWYTPANARTAIGLATWAVPTGIVPLANGGAAAALTASNGGIVYSTASALAVLPGTVTAGQCLLSGSSTTPSWGSCSGAAAVSSVAAANTTLTVSPTTGAVLAGLNLANPNTWTGIQTFTNSDLHLLGSSTGATTFTSANASATNFTLTIPAVTDTMAVLGLSQTFGGNDTFSGTVNFTGPFQVGGFVITWPGAATTVAALNIQNQSVTGGAISPAVSLGTFSSGTLTVNCGLGQQQFLTNNGAFTIAAPANDGACNVRVINGASAGAVTFTGFTVNPSYTGITMTTALSNAYLVTINRNNASSVYFVVPQQ